MPWIVYFIGGGGSFLPGAGLIALAVLGRGVFARRWIKILGIIIAILGIAMVVISAEAVSWWIYIIWGTSTLFWLFRDMFKNRVLQRASDFTALAATFLAAFTAISFQLRPTFPQVLFPRMYVIGDSISAGIGSEGGSTWPKLIGEENHVRVIDLARAGSTIADATRHLKSEPLLDGLVLMEVGGNDIIGHASADQFGKDLDALAQEIRGQHRLVVMLELPLFPFDNAYGLAQRRIASHYGFILIPRRYFAQLLATPGATLDGIHLSATGQQRMAEMMWGFIRPLLPVTPQ
jgi:lysophospholipase L1-like esterase